LPSSGGVVSVRYLETETLSVKNREALLIPYKQVMLQDI
jgi:hypothetical protein